MNPESFKLVVPESAPTEPVSLTEAKLHLRIDHEEEDTYISSLITAAREFCEEHTLRSFVPQSWQLGFVTWPVANFWRGQILPEFRLMRPPVTEVTSIKYRPVDDDDLVTLASTNYTFDPDVLPGVVRFRSASNLPSLNSGYSAPIQVVIECGEDGADAPARVKLAIKQIVTQLYENRVPVVTGAIANEVPMTAKALLSTLKIRKF